jgi:hypothetical protein
LGCWGGSVSLACQDRCRYLVRVAAVLGDRHPVLADFLDLGLVAGLVADPVAVIRTIFHPDTSTPDIDRAAGPVPVVVVDLGLDLVQGLVRAGSILGAIPGPVGPDPIAGFGRESGQVQGRSGSRHPEGRPCCFVRPGIQVRQVRPRRSFGKQATCSWFNLPLRDGCQLKDRLSYAIRASTNFGVSNSI